MLACAAFSYLVDPGGQGDLRDGLALQAEGASGRDERIGEEGDCLVGVAVHMRPHDFWVLARCRNPARLLKAVRADAPLVRDVAAARGRARIRHGLAPSLPRGVRARREGRCGGLDGHAAAATSARLGAEAALDQPRLIALAPFELIRARVLEWTLVARAVAPRLGDGDDRRCQGGFGCRVCSRIVVGTGGTHESAEGVTIASCRCCEE